jgi:hypothetical protein
VSEPVPTFVLGGTGYVAGELLRLISAHPQLKLAAVMSDSQPGEAVAKAFPHLGAVLGDTLFASQQAIEAQLRTLRAPAIFSAAPHGVSAGLIDQLLAVAEQAGQQPRVPIFATRAQQLTRPCTSTPTRHPRAWRSSPAPCQSTSRTLPRGTWRIRAALRPPHCSPRYRCWLWDSRPRSCSSRQ